MKSYIAVNVTFSTDWMRRVTKRPDAQSYWHSLKYGVALAALLLAPAGDAAHAQYLGNYTSNPILPAAPPVLPGTFSNPLGNRSNSPGLYDSHGQFHGTLNANPLDPDSVSNPLGRYGSPLSPDNIHNPLGLGSPLHHDSPNNPLGKGLRIYRPN
jgi:hypothetical protein